MLRANLVSVFLRMQNSAAQELRPPTPLASQSFPQLSVGQALTANIASRLAGGLFLVDIQGHSMQLSLPASAAPGDAVSLRVLRAEPDFMFELLPGPGVGSGGKLRFSPVLSQGAQIVQLALGEARAALAESLPVPAALLSSAPDAAERAPPPGSPAPHTDPMGLDSGITGARSARSGGSTSAQQLAAALQKAIVNSGLFYESHLSDWVQGRRTLAELGREPQAGWIASSGAVAAEILPDEARTMLRQQLETLETRQVAWQGPVWPDQRASFAITEEPPAQSDGQEAATWRTTLDLSLPQLGAIHADLVARGDSLTISIAAPLAQTTHILRSGLPGLSELMRTAGLRPQSLTVADHG